MRYPWANTVLLLLLLVQLATGVGALLSGSARFSWVLWLHGVGAYALVTILLWKGAIIWNVLRRRKLTVLRIAFVLMALLLLAVLASGFYWTYVGPISFFGFSLMVVHGTLAVLLMAPLLWHLLARRWIFRVPAARDRRAFLRLGGSSLFALAFWRGARSTKAALEVPSATRRFTGSYEQGSMTGRFPRVSWLFDAPHPVDSATWRLTIEGAVQHSPHLSYDDLLRLPQDQVIETIDCTGGWYSTQVWQGVRVAHLLEMVGALPSARSITVEAVTGYKRRFGVDELQHYLLATHVADQPLTHGHGAPLRLVAPGHRGYDWVKWVVRLHVNESSKYWQPPLPLQ
ncbi:MAG: molybdopterin-dependent oxidoreductase [Chloroflexota bacterium]|nr:molybdopterin-dependent oxidoreductase [Chloroflexota bacterium]